MTELLLGCETVEVQVPQLPTILVQVPTGSFTNVEEPKIEVEVSAPSIPEFVQITPPQIPQVLILPIAGPEGPPGPPGSGGGGGTGAPRYTYIDPVQLPNGSRTVFTVPADYVVGSLAVYLNGLQEHYITQLTSTTFSFETAPFSTDIIKLEFDALL